MSDLELEKAMLFYLIFEDESYDLSEKDFLDYKNKLIINVIIELQAKKENITILALNEKIQKPEMLEYITHLGDYIRKETAESVYYKLKEYTKKREMFSLLKENQLKIQDAENVDVFIEKLISQMQKIEFQTQKDETFIKQVVETANEIEKNINKKEDLSLYTGYYDLDDLTDGLHNGELTVIGARPGVGKTSFALQLAENIAKKSKNVCYVSLEMSETQMIQKLLSLRTGVNSRKIRNGDMTEEEKMLVGVDCMQLGELNFRLLTKVSTIQQIEISARRLKNKDKLDLLIIDYLQLVRNNGKFNSREQEVADISRTLKLLSLDLGIPIIALCQLNRNASRQEPTLADIRESGAIEQDADNVIFLYQENPENNYVTVDLQKQRAGNIGKIQLKFHKNISRFVSLER